ncbi:MAG: hypothetical protein IAE65_00765 [Ignavibacteria bacterium]|nr:hypothetical protein [Ignavibacteria bacterium]
MLEILGKLTKEEISDFTKFLKSPYFNSDKTNLEILNYFISENIENNTFLKSHFSLEKLDNFRNILDRFLTQKEFERDKNIYKMYNLKALKSKDDRSRFFKLLKKFRKEFENVYKRDENYYSNKVIIETEYYDLMYMDIMFEDPVILKEIKDNIEYNFYFNYLHIYNDYLIHIRNSNKEYKINFRFLDFILEDIRNNEAETKKNHPNVYIIYLTVLISLNSNNYSVSEKLEKEYIAYLKSNERRFDNEQLYHYNLYLLNRYWELLKATGNNDYRYKIFDLYKNAELGGYLLYKNSLDNEHYINIITASLTTENIDWTEFFIKKYNAIIKKDISINNILLTNAKINFIRKKYKNVLESLRTVTLYSPLIHTTTKFIYCKVYYEEKNLDGILNELENLRKYLKRKNNISEYTRLTVSRFRYLFKGLIKFLNAKIITKEKKQTMAKMYIQEINKMEGFVPEKKWFLEKYNELLISDKTLINSFQ